MLAVFNDCLTSGAIGQIDCSTSIAQVGSCLALFIRILAALDLFCIQAWEKYAGPSSALLRS